MSVCGYFLLYIQRSDPTWHPLAVFEPEWLQYDDTNKLLRPPKHDHHPPVLLDNCIYVRYRPSESSNGQLLSYSLVEKSWNILLTPKEAREGYVLATYFNQLVLMGRHSKERQWTNKVWVYQDNSVWMLDDLISPLPACVCEGEIQSAIGHGGLLLVAYKTVLGDKAKATIVMFCNEWKSPREGPPLRIYDRVNIVVHESYIYAVIHSDINNRTLFFRAQLSSAICDIGEWEQLSTKGSSFSSTPRFAVFGKKLIVTLVNSYRHNVVLYTPFTDIDGTLSLVDIDDLNVEFESVDCIVGTSESLLVMGQAKKIESSFHKSSVVKFNSKGTNCMYMYIRT